MNDEVYFWHADKHWSLLQVYTIILGACNKHRSILQIDTIILGVCNQAYSKYLKNKFAYLCNISQKAWRVKLLSCSQMNTNGFYILIVSLWVCIVRHAQNTQNNILRKKWVTKLIFCPQISIESCCKLITWFWWGWSSIPKVPKKASLQCLQYLKKKLKTKLIFCM